MSFYKYLILVISSLTFSQAKAKKKQNTNNYLEISYNNRKETNYNKSDTNKNNKKV